MILEEVKQSAQNRAEFEARIFNEGRSKLTKNEIFEDIKVSIRTYKRAYEVLRGSYYKRMYYFYLALYINLKKKI